MKRQKLINIIIIIFVSILLISTYFSKTIKNMLLPKITVINLKSGAIGDVFETQGTIGYENTHKIYQADNWHIKEISVKVNQKVKKGDILGKVDNNEITLQEREEKIIIMRLENELKTLKNSRNADKNTIRETKYELTTERLKYDQIRKGLTKDGSILSDMDGVIVNINSKGADPNASSDALFEIVDNHPSFSVNFETTSKDAKLLSIDDDINVFLNTDEEDNKEMKITAAISQKAYDSNKDTYLFSAELKDSSDIKAADNVTISSIEEPKRYNNVIPKSSLSEENGLDYIFIVNIRDGALGGEEYVQKVPVQVIAADDKNCAIKALEGQSIPNNYGIVMSTSKAIEDNSEVKLDTEN